MKIQDLFEAQDLKISLKTLSKEELADLCQFIEDNLSREEVTDFRGDAFGESDFGDMDDHDWNDLSKNKLISSILNDEHKVLDICSSKDLDEKPSESQSKVLKKLGY